MEEETLNENKNIDERPDTNDFNPLPPKENNKELQNTNTSAKSSDKAVGKTSAGEETVTIPKGLLDQMLADITALKKGGGGITKIKRITEHHAFVRMYQGNPVLKIEKTWVENKGKSNEIILCKISYLEGKEVKSANNIDYLDFLNNTPAVKVKIIKQVATDKSFSQGVASKRDIKTDYIIEGETVDLEVKIVHYIIDIEFMEGDFAGKTMQIGEEGLNI